MLISAYLDIRCIDRFSNNNRQRASSSSLGHVVPRASLEDDGSSSSSASQGHRSPPRATPSSSSEPSLSGGGYQRPAPLHNFDANLSPRRRKEQDSSLGTRPGVASGSLVAGASRSKWMFVTWATCLTVRTSWIRHVINRTVVVVVVVAMTAFLFWTLPSVIL